MRPAMRTSGHEARRVAGISNAHEAMSQIGRADLRPALLLQVLQRSYDPLPRLFEGRGSVLGIECVPGATLLRERGGEEPLQEESGVTAERR